MSYGNLRERLGVLPLFVMAALILVVVASCNEVDHTKRIEDHKRLAADLRANSLYGAAIEEYRQVLQYDDLDSVGRGNICYLIGRIYFEDITDYEQAAAWFVRAREYDPNGSYVAEASRNLVTSLEKTGKVLDARRQLGAAANLDGQPASDDDVVVARIGDRNIYISEIEGQIELLPAEVQEQFVGRQKKLEYINQYVGIELLYNAAVRENYLADPKVQKELDRVTRTVLVDRFVTQKIMPGVSIDPVDVRNHYEAHKDDLYGGRPLDSVRTQVTRDYQSVKAEAAYNDYINGLVKAEKVEILGQNVK